MRIEQLEYLAAVTQHGSLRRASEQLHLSQPALSEALRNLERELGVTLLDRRRTGARISPQGRDLLPSMVEVLEAVRRLRTAAGDQNMTSRAVRVGTVNAGTSPVLVPAVRDVRAAFPTTTIEVRNAQQAEIHQCLEKGSLDLGLVNVLPGDDVPPGLSSTELTHGRPVVCCRTDHPFAAQHSVSAEQLHEEAFIAMRAGYLMHRFTHRLLGGRLPTGADMGKLMVAQGLGVTVLPDYSIDADPLVEHGVITHRPWPATTRSSPCWRSPAAATRSRPPCGSCGRPWSATPCATGRPPAAPRGDRRMVSARQLPETRGRDLDDVATSEHPSSREPARAAA